MIVLCPRVDELAVRVDDEDAVAQLRRRGGSLLAERAPGAIEGRGQLLGKFQLAAIEQKNPVGRFREHTALRALDVALPSERLRPVDRDLVRPCFFLATLLRQGWRGREADGEHDSEREHELPPEKPPPPRRASSLYP